MAIQVIMPQLGESVEEGTITKWLKKIGETVEEFEPLIEVNTDKVDTEIPSPASGVLLETMVPEGETVKAGTLLAWIGEPDEQVSSREKRTGPDQVESKEEFTPPERVSKQEESISAVPVADTSQGRNRDLGFISPVVARLASQFQVDLHQVKGTGLDGRITKNDLLAYIKNSEITEKEQKSETPKAETSRTSEISAKSEPVAANSGLTPDELIPHNNVRKSIAAHMVMSKHTSPHVTTVMEVDLSRVIAHRNQNKEAFSRDGVNLTFTAYFVSAAVSALKAYPIVNSSWRDDGILVHRDINIGMATSLGEAGLIVPVIKHADQLSLLGFARTINDLAQRARAKQLKPDEVHGGTFSITNHGISGSLFASPIINQPQCAILGVGAIQKRVIVISDKLHGDTIAIRPMVYLSLTFDHRILDGAIADYFLGKVVESLANW
ncbi:MAG TPA: dihydrolipoamide acetyltransferase family protein [Anaerolineales bacterium]|nr:dihydrolipoamide acetyltransferase family protein [Anaerolineales bacterium]